MGGRVGEVLGRSSNYSSWQSGLVATIKNPVQNCGPCLPVQGYDILQGCWVLASSGFISFSL